MGDQLGPGVQNICECWTVSISDIGDVHGFEKIGARAFGLLLSKDGYWMPVQPGEPECDVKLIIIHPHVHLRSGVETVLSYLGNAGRMLLFYPVAPPPSHKSPGSGWMSEFFLHFEDESWCKRQYTYESHYDLWDGSRNPSDASCKLYDRHRDYPRRDLALKMWMEILPSLKLQWDWWCKTGHD